MAFACACALLLPLAGWAQTLRVAVHQNPPKVETTAPGRATGLFVEVLEAIAAQEGWTLQYVPVTFAQGLALLEHAEVDVMPDVARTPQREPLFLFHDEPVLHSWSQVYARPQSGIRTVLDLAGKRVAVLAGSAQEGTLRQLTAGFAVGTTLVPRPDYAGVLQEVLQGRADALVTNPFHGPRHVASTGLEDTAIVFSPQRLHFALRRDSDPAIAAAIDRHLRGFKGDPGSRFFEPLQHWSGTPRPEVLPAWLPWMAGGGALLLALAFGWALSLQRAAARLRESERRQRRSAEQLARIFNHSLDAICVFDRELRFLRVSRAAEKLWGYAPEELLRRRCVEIMPESEREMALRGLERIRQGEASTLETRVRRKDGSTAYVLWSAAWSDSRGEMYCIARDDTQRRKLVAYLEKRSLQLQRANNDLKIFSQSVSHDLRGPVGVMAGFVDKVLRDEGERLTPRGHDLLSRALAATHRMEQIIEDLLRLARISTGELAHKPVDLAALAGEVVQALAQAQPRPELQVDIEPGLAADGDPRLLRLALENLLGNAWKFTRGVAAPRIAVGREHGPEGTVFFVRDNGAGFDMEYAARLFAPFQRLHAQSDFEGTGVGLSIVHRIITRHGGRIWGEGQPGQGAVFRFTLA